MKKTIMKLMVILLAAMMLCSYTFAVSYSCSCGTDRSSASSSGGDPELSETMASFSGSVRIYGGTWQPVSGYSSVPASSTSCHDNYDTAYCGSIDSSHYISGENYYDWDSFGL